VSKEVQLSKSTMIVSETDTKGIITYANNDFCRLAGYTKEELINQAHNIVRHPDMPKIAFKGLWDTIAQGKTWNGIVKNKCKNGDYYWVNATAYPVTKKDGTIKLISVRRKPTEDEVRNAEALYKQLKKDE
jgi:aerotaxis receptor